VRVATAIVVEYAVVISPMRSGKYVLTRGGSRMFPTPTAAKISAVPSSSDTASFAKPRSNVPIATTAIEITVSRSSPRRRSNSGVRMPNTA
jgi:hypothetical protein